MATTQTPTRPRHAQSTGPETETSEFLGVLGQFDDPDTLVEACAQARSAGYKKLDAYSPFPVHGIDDALGIRRSRLPFLVLVVGTCGCFFGLFMQWYCNRASFSPIFPGYDFIISGKPLWSLPANIPVTFECIVLSSAFATFLGMLALNRLPRLANPLHRISRFKRATNDRFFLLIEKSDESFDLDRATGQLNDWGATGVESVERDLTDHKMPAMFRPLAMIFVLLLLVPPAAIYRSMNMTTTKTRLHVVPDMDWQYRFQAQNVGPRWSVNREEEYFFPDLRVMRPQMPGTIARGDLHANTEYYTGIKAESGEVPASRQTDLVRSAEILTTLGAQEPANQEPATGEPATKAAAPQDAAGQPSATQEPAVPEPDWLTEFPVSIDEAMLHRGRDRFNIYCTVCHGYSGEGNGLVSERALELAVSSVVQKGTTTNATWTKAKSMFDPTVINQPVGRIFDTITNGRGTMGPYGTQISTSDRWAIVLYVKALQATRAKEVAAAQQAMPAEGAAPNPANPAASEPKKDGTAAEPAKQPN